MAQATTYRFPVDVRWLEGKLTLASVPGKEPLEVATPPEFQGGVEGVCLVAVSLDTPVHVHVTVTAGAKAA
jgi:hypothetical protein